MTVKKSVAWLDFRRCQKLVDWLGMAFNPLNKYVAWLGCRLSQKSLVEVTLIYCTPLTVTLHLTIKLYSLYTSDHVGYFTPSLLHHHKLPTDESG